MLSLLWLVPILPLVGFAILAVTAGQLARKAVSVIAVGAVSLSALIAIGITVAYTITAPAGTVYSQTLWQWMRVGNFAPAVALHLDALSMTMMVVVAFVSALIHIYSTGFMADDTGYSRFFAYMNLFVGAMLTLVLADNLLLLYLGWEGVGLCSYLLIGFWYRDPDNVRAALKAFFVTRIGDTAFAIGIFLLFTSLGTLNIPAVLDEISTYAPGSTLPTAAAALLLVGAMAKSAQLPLQTWLPDAMAGPTPVSALIHAATMVTAGVYLIARMHTLFVMAPAVLLAVAIIGAVTQLVASFSALTQYDIKRILAYSTISQIGYMFLALGVGAWAAAIYHFGTHAFFKAALFLGAGVVIKMLDEEHDIFKMGGLRHRYPLTFWAFLFAALTLAAVPPLTITFNSKDLILNQAFLSKGGRGLWILGLIGTFLTAAYTFRMVFVVFFGPAQSRPEKTPARSMVAPFVVLAFLGAIAGIPELLTAIFGSQNLSSFLRSALPGPTRDFPSADGPWLFQLIYVATALAGIAVAYLLYERAPQYTRSVVSTSVGSWLHRWWFADWGFDWLYQKLFVGPYVVLARINRNDVVDLFYKGLALISRVINGLLSSTVNGNVRWYVAAVAGGAVIVVGLVVIL
ncbi:MAG: NADH-quinone oxidoreductase subunit L [Planctomycetes bacterium]|nr:NADH-quinone oxidoreductase subunit L [Planctomycetota bacterium]